MEFNTRAELKRYGKESLAGKWGGAILALLIVSLIAGFAVDYTVFFEGSGSLNVMSSAFSILQFIIGGALTLGVAMFFLKIIRNEKVAIENIFDGFKLFSKAFVLQFLMGLFVFLWSLLLVIPGIIKAISYSMSFYILADHPELSASEALKSSMNMMQGHKMRLFILSLSFIGWFLLSALTLGILYIVYVGPYMMSTQTHFYEELKSFHENKENA